MANLRSQFGLLANKTLVFVTSGDQVNLAYLQFFFVTVKEKEKSRRSEVISSVQILQQILDRRGVIFTPSELKQ